MAADAASPTALPPMPAVPAFGPVPTCHTTLEGGSLNAKRARAEACLAALREHLNRLDGFDRGLFKYVEMIDGLYQQVNQGAFTFQQKKQFYNTLIARRADVALRRSQLTQAQAETRSRFDQVRNFICWLPGSHC